MWPDGQENNNIELDSSIDKAYWISTKKKSPSNTDRGFQVHTRTHVLKRTLFSNLFFAVVSKECFFTTIAQKKIGKKDTKRYKVHVIDAKLLNRFKILEYFHYKK